MTPTAPRKSLMRKRASRLAAAQALYSEALIEKSTGPALLVAQILQSWADSKLNDTADLPHGTQPEAALDLLSDKMAHAQRTKAQAILTANPGCMLQLEAGVRRYGKKQPVRHVVELLDESYGKDI